MTNGIKKGVTGAAAKLQEVRKKTSEEIAQKFKTGESFFPEKKVSMGPPTPISFVQTPPRVPSGFNPHKMGLFLQGINWWKLLLVVGMVTGGFFLFIKFGAGGGLIAAGGFILVVLMMLSSGFLKIVSTLFKGIFFTAVILGFLFVLAVYAHMPGWMLLVCEFILVIGFLKVDAKAGSIVIVLLVIFFPYADYYATNVISPDSALAKTWSSAQIDVKQLTSLPQRGYDQITRQVKRDVALASGDYYTSMVDAGSKQQLGVFMEEIETPFRSASFVQGEPLKFFTSVKARALDFAVGINFLCESEGVKGVVIPEKKDFFGKKTEGVGDSFDQTAVDCDFSSEDSLKFAPGSHTVKLSGVFNFATRGYLNMYLLDRIKLNDWDRRNLLSQWKSSLPSNAMDAITTRGPVKIGIDSGRQPVGVSQKTAGPTIGITIDNALTGKVKKLENMVLLLPKGLSIVSINGRKDVVRKSSCDELSEIEQKGCSDDSVNVHRIDLSSFVGSDTLSGFDFVSFRVLTLVDDYNTLLAGTGGTGFIPKRVRVMVSYEYELSKEKTFTIKTPATIVTPAPSIRDEIEG